MHIYSHLLYFYAYYETRLYYKPNATKISVNIVRTKEKGNLKINGEITNNLKVLVFTWGVNINVRCSKPICRKTISTFYQQPTMCHPSICTIHFDVVHSNLNLCNNKCWIFQSKSICSRARRLLPRVVFPCHPRFKRCVFEAYLPTNVF